MDDELCVLRQVCRVESFLERDGKPMQDRVGVESLFCIGPCHAGATGAKNFCKSGHASSLDADHVNAKSFEGLREKQLLGQPCLLGGPARGCMPPGKNEGWKHQTLCSQPAIS